MRPKGPQGISGEQPERTGSPEAILRQDLPAFIRKTFNALSPVRPLSQLAYRRPRLQLERSAAARPSALSSTCPPRSLKSITASVRFPAFVLGPRPDAAHHMRQLLGRTCPQALERFPRRSGQRWLPVDLFQHPRRSLQGQRGGRSNEPARISARDLDRRHPDRPWRRSHRH